MHDACLKMMCCVHFLYYNYDIVLIFFFFNGYNLHRLVDFGCVSDDDGSDFKPICTSVLGGGIWVCQ